MNKLMGQALRQLDRHDGEYLLRELSGGGFLPSHGFPLHVIPFVNTSVESIMAEEAARQDDDREDGRYQYRSYPSRELNVAICEYAPGNNVVIDGLSYTSAGLILNWQIPPNDAAVKEIQALRWVWWCRSCGAFETTTIRQTQCSCGSDQIENRKYIEPSGFAVDIRVGCPNSPETEQSYVPATSPRVTCNGEWLSMSNPALGRFRYAPDGRVFHHSKGATEFGYAVCLECGRVASETGWQGDGAPVPFDERTGQHTRLRTGKKSESTHICSGSDQSFSIQRNLWLGGEEFTDVVQLRLQHPRQSKRLLSEEAATSLAVGLRTCLAKLLGVEAREIGWAVQSTIEDGVFYRDLFLYDAAAGGAGYVAEVPVHLEDLLLKCRDALSVCTCDKACHGCLLDFDTQRSEANLNRVTLLEWLDNEFMQAMHVPEQFQCFGPDTRYESRTVLESLLAECRTHGLREIRVYTNGDTDAWDIQSWRPYRHLATTALSNQGVIASIVMPASIRKKLDWATLHACVTRAETTGIELRILPDAQCQVNDGMIAAEVLSIDRSVSWAVFDKNALVPDGGWGNGSTDSPIVRYTEPPRGLVTGDLLTTAMIDQERPYQCSVYSANGELNGVVSDVGRKFWGELIKVAPWLQDAIDSGSPTEIEYRDRYLVSPFSCRLLYEVLKALLKQEGSIPSLKLLTMRTISTEHPRFLFHNWSDSQEQESTLASLLKTISKPEIYLMDRFRLPHARTMKIKWPNEMSASITFDQGMGFARSIGRMQHRFGASAATQASSILSMSFNTEQHNHQVPFYVMRGE